MLRIGFASKVSNYCRFGFAAGCEAVAIFTIDNLQVEGSRAIQLPLGGGGIRGIEYDGRENLFRIISGAAEDQDQTDFSLWEWNGNEQQPALRETNRFDDNLKPEGVARVTAGGRDFIIIVFDSSGYTVMA